MPGFVKYLLLGVVGLTCFGIGLLGSGIYVGMRGALDGSAYTCKILDVAEKKGILTKQQRAILVSRDGKTGEPMASYLISDCAKTPWQATTDMWK
jgi:hypothetical protein